MTGGNAGPPVVVTLPGEIDLSNAAGIGDDLMAVLETADLVVADMSETVFCDSSGIRMLIVARMRAQSNGATLRVVVRSGGTVARSLAVSGFGRVLSVYHSLQDATRTQPGASQPAS